MYKGHSAAAKSVLEADGVAEQGAAAQHTPGPEESIVPCEKPWRPGDYLPLPPCTELPEPMVERQEQTSTRDER